MRLDNYSSINPAQSMVFVYGQGAREWNPPPLLLFHPSWLEGRRNAHNLQDISNHLAKSAWPYLLNYVCGAISNMTITNASSLQKIWNICGRENV